MSTEFLDIQRINIIAPQISLQNIKIESTLLDSFYKFTITLTPKPHKHPTKKENYRSIFLMDTVAKTLYKALANLIKTHQKYYQSILNSKGARMAQHK